MLLGSFLRTFLCAAIMDFNCFEVCPTYMASHPPYCIPYTTSDLWGEETPSLTLGQADLFVKT
ncbi:hypothetical protein WA026_008538 [Henosepilachna vigintioctopunctata]|uniref:Uncharacterized protein n=1 Tax=Henosepilachna vigintioctopunctata TaxID=420089 RepID=A0AAW1UIT1_9CUCU